MTILVAPLNWGLGHASRCVPLVRKFLDEGHEVILGGDGESLTLLRRHFPKLRYVYLAPLHLRYSAGKRQVGAILCSLPRLIRWAVQDHAMLQSVLREEHIDRVVSDNRFGLYIKRSQTTSNDLKQPQTVYITHQLHIMFPKGWKWAERIAERLHARVYRCFDKVWVPDYADSAHSLAGTLSHLKTPHANIEYIGPLSRFQNIPINPNTQNYNIVAVLSGLEPQRTLFEKEIIARYQGTDEQVLIVQGLMNRPNTRFKRSSITIVPYLNDAELIAALLHANRIIARSGYSTIMDLDALGLIEKAELIPTPGQPEQEYLAFLLCKK